jgi:Protein of unknown function (DUF1236)
MKHRLLISVMSFALIAGAGPSFAINPGPAALGLGGGLPNDMAGQRLTQLQPGQGQQGGEQDQATPGSKPAKRSTQSQPSGQTGEKMGQQGEKMGLPIEPGGRKKASGEALRQQGEKIGSESQPKGQKKASESEPSGQGQTGASGEQSGKRMGTSAEQSGSRMGAGGGKQPGVGGSETERGESGVGSGAAAGVKGSASLSVRERSKITTVIKEAKVQPLENVTFSISVGTRIPHEVHLYPLPREVVEIHPVWRHYEYILVRNEIIVVNPANLEIVAVLPLA